LTRRKTAEDHAHQIAAQRPSFKAGKAVTAALLETKAIGAIVIDGLLRMDCWRDWLSGVWLSPEI
jgi:hypothetical protein